MRLIKSPKMTTGSHLGAWMTRYSISQYDIFTGKPSQSNTYKKHD